MIGNGMRIFATSLRKRTDAIPILKPRLSQTARNRTISFLLWACNHRIVRDEIKLEGGQFACIHSPAEQHENSEI
jgi:hypothetical protein